MGFGKSTRCTEQGGGCNGVEIGLSYLGPAFTCGDPGLVPRRSPSGSGSTGAGHRLLCSGRARGAHGVASGQHPCRLPPRP